MKHARAHRPWRPPEGMDGWGVVLAIFVLIVLALVRDVINRSESERRYQELQRAFERERAEADLTGRGRR